MQSGQVREGRLCLDKITRPLVVITEPWQNCQGDSTVKKDPIMRFYVSLPMTRLQKMELIKLDTTCWLRHLSAVKSDWATNLILYYLFKKDAAAFVSIHKKRQQWLKLKQDDIDYWQNLFRKMDYNNAGIKQREKLLMIE
jgi:hypothetical protein